MSSTTETVTVQLGRPVNMESNRQKRLAEIAERKAEEVFVTRTTGNSCS